MDAWDLFEYAAWVASGLLGGWMLINATLIGRSYSEDVLLSSREGEDALEHELHGTDLDRI